MSVSKLSLLVFALFWASFSSRPCQGQQETNDFSKFLEKQLKADEEKIQQRLQAGNNGLNLRSVLAGQRKQGLVVADITIKRLKQVAADRFPGIRDFCEDLTKEDVLPDPTKPVSQWQDFSADSLTINNPNFWRAYFEVDAGHGLMELIHCSLLKAEGQCVRSLQNSVVARLGKHEHSLADLHVKNAVRSQMVFDTAVGKISEGIELFEKKEYDQAGDLFKEILSDWPQCGLASFELGLTIYHAREHKAGRTIPRVAQLPEGHPSRPSEEIFALYKTARQHDPMIRNAYQGPGINKQLIVMARSVVPAYQKLSNLASESSVDKELAVFGLGSQMVGLHDYAIFARQVFVSKKGRPDEKDLAYFKKSLNELIDEETTKAIIDSLAKAEGKRFYFKPVVNNKPSKR